MKKIIIFAIIFITVSINISFSQEQTNPTPINRNFSGALWIVRHNISTPEKIDKLLDVIKDTDIKNLFVQVRGRGDSYYDSKYEPLAFDVAESFDPLKYLIEKTHKSDIKIHAWVNVSFVLNAEDYPPNKKHVLSKHPKWVTYDSKGKPMTTYSSKELDKNLAEGYFIDPGIPAAKTYFYNIIKDIIAKYPVNGIHLDYIRYPYSGYSSHYKKNLSDFGYNPIALKIFKKKYGFDPLKPNKTSKIKKARQKELFDKFRMDQITEIVKNVNKIVKSKNEDIILSAAVMPRHDRAKEVYFQDWPLWMEKNYIDIACVMSYSDNMKDFDEFINYANDKRFKDRIKMGIGVIKQNSDINITAEQIKKAYDNEIMGYSIFSFDHDKNFIQKLSELIKNIINKTE
ncbi:MAG: family 10 glycosylhydrolase [Leptospirales bacterium]|nr:family 10 glycosylhydrolase [Leptospirales bacterium]